MQLITDHPACFSSPFLSSPAVNRHLSLPCPFSSASPACSSSIPSSPFHVGCRASTASQTPGLAAYTHVAAQSHLWPRAKGKAEYCWWPLGCAVCVGEGITVDVTQSLLEILFLNLCSHLKNAKWTVSRTMETAGAPSALENTSDCACWLSMLVYTFYLETHEQEQKEASEMISSRNTLFKYQCRANTQDHGPKCAFTGSDWRCIFFLLSQSPVTEQNHWCRSKLWKRT